MTLLWLGVCSIDGEANRTANDNQEKTGKIFTERSKIGVDAGIASLSSVPRTCSNKTLCREG